MVVNHNRNQLDVGKKIVKDIEGTSNELKSTIDSNIADIKSVAANYKVNLDDVINVGNIDTIVSDFNTKLGQTSALADTQNAYLDDYDNGDLATEAITQMLTKEELLRRKVHAANNEVHPDALTRTAATAGLGVAMFTEGFIGFFEDIGDAGLSIGSGVTGVLGFKDASEQLKGMADFEFSKNLVEENDAFKWLNKTSYFDKDSTYGKVCKSVGKATAAAVTTHCISKGVAGHLESTGKIKNLAEDATQLERSSQAMSQAKKTAERIDMGRKVIQKEVKNVGEHVEKGESLPQAVAMGTVETAGEQAVESFVVKPVSKSVIEKTKLGQHLDEYFLGNGEAIEGNVNETARAAVSTASRAAGDEVTSEMIEGVGDFVGIEEGTPEAATLDFFDDVTGKFINGVGKAKS